MLGVREVGRRERVQKGELCICDWCLGLVEGRRDMRDMGVLLRRLSI